MADIYSNPVIPPSPSIDDYYNQSMQRIQQIGLRTREMLAPEEPEPTARTAKVALDASTGKLFIGGYVVDKNNDTDVAVFSKYAGQEAELPEGNWQDVDPNSFTQYVQGIRDPGTLKLMARNFGMGVDEMQQMAGLGLQWAGAESAGQYLADQEADLQPNQVYSRSFTDIGSSPENGVLDWMAATIGRLGPNIVESTISAAAGAAIGGAASGPAAPAGAPIGAIAGFFGKTAVKTALLEAAKKRLKGEALDAAEKKLLLSAGAMTNESLALAGRMRPAALAAAVDAGTLKGAQAIGGQVARRAAQVGGAAGLSTASNIFQQTGAAYGETMADGSEGNRAAALGVGIIGGLADTIPEFILAGRLFSELGGDVIGAAKKQKSAMDILKGAASGRTGRIVKGAGAGAAIEGGTEGFQEVLQIAANPILDLGSAEASNRIVNAFAAGALMGGTLGGAGGAFAGNLASNKQEANLLLPVSQSDPAYAQYREDLKAKVGEAGYNKIFPRMAPPRAQPVPLSGGEPTTFQVGPTPAIPNVVPGPAFGTSGTATGTLPQGMQVTPTPGVMAVGAPSARPPVAPAPAPAPAPVTGTGLSMGTTGTPAQLAGAGTFEQFQAAAMQQAQQAAAAAAAAPAPAPLTRMPGGSALQQAATGELPGAQPPSSMMLRRGPGSALAQTAEMQGPAAPMPGSPTVNMNRLLRGGTSGQASATMVPPLRPTSMVGRAGDISLRRSGQATGRMVQPISAAANLKRPAAPAGGRTDALGFLSNLVDAGQNTFNTSELGSYLFPKKTKLTAVDRQRVNVVIDGLVRDKLVSEGPIGTYTVDTEKVSAPKPGAGTGSAAPAGKREGKDRGTSAGDKLRADTATTGKKPASETQGTPSGGKPLQAEEDVQPAVTAANLAETWDRAHRQDRSDEWFQNGTAESNPAFNALGDSASRIQAHGMSKSATLGKALKDLIELVGGKGNAKLNTAPLSGRVDEGGVLGTAGGVAYRSGPFIITFREGVVGDTSPANITGILVNPAHPELVAPLQEMFPNLTVRTFTDVADVVAASKVEPAKGETLKKGGPPSPKAPEVAATSAKKAAELEAEIRKQNAEQAAKVQAAEAIVAAKRAEEEAAKRAVESAKADDIRDVEAAITEANNAEGEALAQNIADLILLSKDKDISQEARDRAKDYLDSELDPKSIEYLNAEALIAGRNTDLDARIVSETITQFNAGKPLGQYAIAKAREAWNRLQSKKLDPDYEGAKLSSYINPKDSQFFNVQFTPEGRRIVSKTFDEESKKGRNMLSMYDSVENAVDEDGRPLKPIDRIKFKSIVDTFKRGLAKAPQISIYKNQADLRTKNPNLYQRAVAARPQGDFDTARAAGYAFGEDQVIIFSDRIATPKMLRMVLAHEAIGHFGMRALLPAKQFDALMQYVYDNSLLARSVVDSEVEYSGMDRREAIEEYLANYASKLDTSIVTRIWNTIKGALNKLGIQFDDDITRYLVNHARRYTREGASFFEPSKFALKVLDVESNMNGSGRFNIPSILPMQRELSFKLDMAGGMPATLTEAWDDLKDRGINTAQAFDNLVRTFFRLANYDALRNHGAATYETLINGVRTVVAALRNQYNEDLADIMGLDGESRNAFSFSMYIGRSIAHQRFKLDPGMRSASLVKLVKNIDTGETEIVADNEQLEKFLKLGIVSKDELNNGVTVKTPLPTSIFGTYKDDEVKIEGVRSKLGRDLTDEEYQYYLKGRRKMAEIEIDLLKARYENYLKTEKISISGVRKILSDGKLTEADMALVKNALNHAKSLIAKKVEYDAQGLPTITSDGLSEANAFLAKFNEALIKSDEKYTDALKNEVRAFYENAKQSDAVINAIEKFRERRRTISPELTREVVFAVQDRLKEIVLADQMFEKAQAQARRTIAQGYIPVFREGGWQIRVEAQIDDESVTLHPEHQNKLILRLEDDRASSERGAKALNAAFNDVEAEVLVLQKNGTYKTQKVKLFARASKTVDNVAADPSLDIDNFLHGMRMFGLATNPQAIEKVITTLTNPGNALRKALRFDDTPGYDMTAGITAMARHIVTRASLIAKTQFEPAMRELLDRTSSRGKLWFGDAEAVMTAKAKFDAATDEREREFYRGELITNLYKYRMTNPGAENWDGSRSTFPGRPEEAELGNIFYNNAIRTQQWLDGSENIAESTFEGKRMPAFLKAITSVAFLGGSMAQFAQNLISPITNVIPYLASKNGKTGFGGGFGVMAATIEYNRAFKDVVGISGLKFFSRVKDESGKYSFRIGDPINDAKYYFDIAKEFETARATKDTAREAELQAQYGLSYFEARNIGREIREGKLIPAQANAVLETSRGLYADSKLGRAWLKFTDGYMVPFNISEQAARRATFLAAFRLEFNRLKQAGMNEEAASERARAFGVQTVDLTLGEYSTTNRPPAWREGVQSLLFMYKTYPITATLLMRNLSYGGKIGMLTGLMLLSGLSGLPFAEDLEDLIDTLAQKFGMDIGQGPALRKFLTEQLDEAFPGIAPYVIKGVANQFLPADIASKTGIGSILPGTGALLAGSDPSHELAEVAGPIFGMGYNMVKATYDVIRAPVSDTVTLTDAFRNAPVSLMRSVGDVAMYLQSGAIVDKRGYVVSPEVSAATVLTRLLGFYPVEASNQYEFIKYSRRATDYQKQISMSYRDAWIKAMISNDTQQAAKIAQAVNDWNEANPNARLNNWMKNAQRALKEARRPAGERFLKSAPKASRENLERYLNATVE